MTPAPAHRAGTRWRRIAAAGEVALAAAAVVADVLVPTLVILGLAAVSLAVRREGLGTLGLVRRHRRLVLPVLGLTCAWTAVQLAVVMPTLNHLTGSRQDLSQFEDLEGDLPALLVLLALSWTLAAFGEEIAYRGLVLTRARDALGQGSWATVVAVLLAALLFGLAHTEQGGVGVALTALDAVFFSWLRFRYRTLYASVLAHGFNNTIGLTGFFLLGPVYGLW